MASVLTIGGATIDRADNATRCILNRLTLSLDQPDALEFAQVGTTLPGAWHPGQAVTLTVDGALAFSGQVTSRHPATGPGGITVGYRALGLKWLANRIPVTNGQDGTGQIVYNLPSSDDDYIASESGLSVGTILSDVFTAHATALAALGITTDATTASQLAALTIVPDEPVLFQGSRLWNSIEDFLTQWYPQYAAYIPAAGTIRVVDTTAFPATTYTLDSDPVELESIAEDASECASRVVLRGYADVEPAYLSLAAATLSEAFTATDKAAWTWYSFTQPAGAADSGTISTVTSTQVTVSSSDATTTWSVNYWSGIEGWIFVYDPAATGITFGEWRHITANTALGAGGTSVITLDLPLNNSGYTAYTIAGQPLGTSETWRTYNVVPTYVGQHLVKQFPRSVPWRATDSVVQTNYPAAVVCWSSSGSPPFIEFPATFEVLPLTGQIRFSEPTVRIFGTLSNLELGGSHTDGIPDDIQVLVPYSRGALTAVYPPDVGGVAQYDGPAHALYGLERTYYRDYRNWVYAGDATSYQALAQQVWNTVNAPVIEGTLAYQGKLSAALTLGTSLNLTGNGYTTGYEAIAAAVRTVTLEWPQEGATPWVTRLEFSTRRRAYSGDKLYEHPMFAAGSPFAFQEGTLAPTAAAAQASLSGALGDIAASGPGAQLGQALGSEGFDAGSVLARQGDTTDLGVPAVAPGYGGAGDPGIPTSLQDLGVPTSLQDLGIDPTGGFDGQ